MPEFETDSEQVDWREWRVLRSVQDQKQCASAYAFSSTAVAESSYAIKTGVLYDLSE